jgi:beta-1,4-mannosyltransferase
MKAKPGAEDPPRVTIISKVLLNPYVRLLRAAVEATGIPCLVDRDFGVPWLRARRGQVDVVHIHWLEMLYQYPRLGQRLRRSVSVIAAMVLARLWGIRLLYTVHNLAPHEQPHPIWSSLVDWFTFNLTDAIHVHDSVMAEQVARRYGRRRAVHTIAHGNYIGAYPDECTREDARRRLEIESEALVYLFLGQLRRYKGIEALLDAYETIETDTSALLIAGRARDEEYGREVEATVAGRRGVRLHLGFVPDDEVQYYMRACDVCVLPYRQVSTSGAAILAFSFGVPVVAPRMGCFVDLIGVDRGVLFDPDRPTSLAEALDRVRDLDLDHMRRAALAYARTLDWGALGEQHARLYRELVSSA